MMGSLPELGPVLEHYGIDFRPIDREQLILCPAHSENQPSCSLNLDKGLMHCHACGFAGNSVTLIAERESLDNEAAFAFAEAHLGFTPDAPSDARRYGVSGGARSRGGGYRPRVRRRAGLARA